MQSEVKQLVLTCLRKFKGFPSPEVTFLDFNKCFSTPYVLKSLVDFLVSKEEIKPGDIIVAPEARGFILGPVLAYKAGVGFVPFRKKGKLPDFGNLKEESYSTEYSDASICVDLDLFQEDLQSSTVIIYDDVLATGGTAIAVAKLVSLLSPAKMKFCCLAEIPFLKGRQALANSGFVKEGDIFSLLEF